MPKKTTKTTKTTKAEKMETKVHEQQKPSSQRGLAIAGLIINILILPGLGTVIGGDVKIGIIQMIISIAAIPLIFIIIGWPIMLAVKVWSIVSSVQQIKKYS